MKEKDPFDFERFKAEAMQGLYEGKSLSPNDGVLAPLIPLQWHHPTEMNGKNQTVISSPSILYQYTSLFNLAIQKFY
ncbi:hypothetical protein [Sphingobacterium sp.]|uniref:hypothetical protein n=1 Tax=Sphingobacterium sp. TaxID=341027 RepID=UPI002FDED705